VEAGPHRSFDEGVLVQVALGRMQERVRPENLVEIVG
jgi:hypothetical protein